MRPRNVSLCIFGLILLVVVVSCGQPSAETPRKPERPSNEVIEQVIGAAMVESFSLDIEFAQGEYTVTAGWEAPADEDPTTQYWLLVGTANGGFLPGVRITTADARRLPSAQSAGEMAQYEYELGAEQLAHINDLLSRLEANTLVVEEAARYVEALYALASAKQDFGGSDLPRLIEILERSSSESGGPMPEDVIWLAETMDEMGLHPMLSWFDTDRQLLPASATTQVTMITDLAREYRIAKIEPPVHEKQSIRLHLFTYNRKTGTVPESDPQAATPLRETMVVNVEMQGELLAEIRTPNGDHAIVICDAEDRLPTDDADGHVTHCQPDFEWTVFPLLDENDWIESADLTVKIQGVGNRSESFASLVVTPLAQPGLNFTFEPGSDIDATGGTDLTIFGRDDGQDHFPFGITAFPPELLPKFVAFWVRAYDEDDELMYEDVLEFALGNPYFTKPFE